MSNEDTPTSLLSPMKPGEETTPDGQKWRDETNADIRKWNTHQQRWWDYYLSILDPIRAKSEDTSTQVAALLIGDHDNIISTGYNGFARGVEYTSQRGATRPEKYLWMEHAERNAIYNAARSGIRTDEATMVTDGIPCVNCGRAVIQAGITEVIVNRMVFNTNTVWLNEAYMTLVMFEEAGVNVYTRDAVWPIERVAEWDKVKAQWYYTEVIENLVQPKDRIRNLQDATT